MITLKVTADNKTKRDLEKLLNQIVGTIEKVGGLSPSINEIIIVGDLSKSKGDWNSIIRKDLRNIIKAYCQRYDVPEQNTSKGKAYTPSGKIVFFRDSYKIFYLCYFLADKVGVQSLLELILSIFLNEEFQKVYPWKEEYLTTDPLDKILNKGLLGVWVSNFFNQNWLNEKFPDRLKCENSAKAFTQSFKGNIRKTLFKYQKNENDPEFKKNLIRELDYYIRRSIEIYVDNDGKVNDLEEFTIPMSQILLNISLAQETILQRKSPKIFKLKKAIRDLFRICELEITIFGPFDIKVKKSPVNVFKDIVDTETRIVAFVDILGFSALIDEYDNDETSNILNELHDALELSIKYSLEIIAGSKIKTMIAENLDYKLFSDCLCLSLPFIEYDTDFQKQFDSICIILRNYQSIMMQKGFYVRGGVAIGSYYSNDKMIFSGGLVKAYHLESKKAIYPIIIVSEDIIAHLETGKLNTLSENYNEQPLMYHIDEPDKIFINPFEDIDNLDRNRKSIEENLNLLNKADHILGKLLKPIVNSFFKNVENYTKNEELTKSKENALDVLRTKMNTSNERVLVKLKFLEALILWSIDQNTNTKFRKYEFLNTN